MVPLTEAKLKQLFADLVATSHLTRSKAFLGLKTLNLPGTEGGSFWSSFNDQMADLPHLFFGFHL